MTDFLSLHYIRSVRWHLAVLLQHLMVLLARTLVCVFTVVKVYVGCWSLAKNWEA